MKTYTLMVKKQVEASCQQVFEAWSKPEIVKQWLFPAPNGKATMTNTFKVGGHYQLDMWTEEGTLYQHTGEYKEIIPNKKIVFSWTSPVVENTLVTVELQEVNGKTEITLTHELFPDKELRGMHQDGWTGCLENLQNFFLHD